MLDQLEKNFVLNTENDKITAQMLLKWQENATQKLIFELHEKHTYQVAKSRD